MLRQLGKLLVPRLDLKYQPLALTVQRKASDVSSGSHSQPMRSYEKCVNQVTLLGRVGTEPQKRGNDKHPVVIFTLATNSRYESSGELMVKTDWHRISVFKPSLRDTVYTYLRKGQRIYITGKLSYGEIKDEDGTTRQSTSIIADEIVFFQSND